MDKKNMAKKFYESEREKYYQKRKHKLTKGVLKNTALLALCAGVLLADIGVGINDGIRTFKLSKMSNRLKLYYQLDDKKYVDKEIEDNKKLFLTAESLEAFYEMSEEEQLSYIHSQILKGLGLGVVIIPTFILVKVLGRVLEKKQIKNIDELNKTIYEYYIDESLKNSYYKPSQEYAEYAFNNIFDENYTHEVALQNTRNLDFSDEHGSDLQEKNLDEERQVFVKYAIDMKDKVSYEEYRKWLGTEYADMVFSYYENHIKEINEKMRDNGDFYQYGVATNYFDNIAMIYDFVSEYKGMGDKESVDEFLTSLSYTMGMQDFNIYRSLLIDSDKQDKEYGGRRGLDYSGGYHGAFRENYEKELPNLISILLKDKNHNPDDISALIKECMFMFDKGYEEKESKEFSNLYKETYKENSVTNE